MQKKGFTLIEILIVIFVISMGLILIIRGMSETHRYLSETAQKTIALNLAKEGIEAVYNLRNSNWRKWSDKKNECWLVSSPLSETTQNCEQLSWLQTGTQYVISNKKPWLEEFNNQNDSIEEIPRISWSYKRRIWVVSLRDKTLPWQNIKQSDNEKWSYLSYYCTKAQDIAWKTWKQCGDSSPKELRFCSQVDYSHPHQWSIKICSIMTNFEQ